MPNDEVPNDEVRAKAQEWLNARSSKTARAVKANTIQQGVAEHAHVSSPAAQDLTEHWGAVAHNPEAIWEDVFQILYQGQPALRDKAGLNAAGKVSASVAEAMIGNPRMTDLRARTKFDRWSSMMTINELQDPVREVLQELKEQADEEQAAEQAADDAAASLQKLLDASSSPGDADDADAAGDADADIGSALQDAMDADLSAERAGAGLDDDAARSIAVSKLNKPMRDAADKAEEESLQESAWGYGPGTLQSMSDDDRERLRNDLKTNRMAEFAKLIGRFKLAATAARTQKIESGRREPFTVELGDRLDDVLGSELVKLGVPSLRLDTLRRLGERQLVQRKWRGDQKVGAGPMVILVDTSWSMLETLNGARGGKRGLDAPDPNENPTREAWAKAVTLALCDSVKADKRKVDVILFSDFVRDDDGTLHAGRHVSVPLGESPQRNVALLQIANEFHGSGTNYENPLMLARELIEAQSVADSSGKSRQDKQRTDIVLITDGECAVPYAFEREWQEWRDRTNVRCWGIVIGGRVTHGLKQVTTNARSITDFTDTSIVSDIFATV